MNKKVIFKVTAFPIGNKVFVLYKHKVVKGIVKEINLHMVNEEVVPDRYLVNIPTAFSTGRTYSANEVFANKADLLSSL
jgi:hypothetical protein